ncbi:MAG TPA: thiamine pyrophosphate-dependent enzyme [Candidatus Bathyarchaeia archaeon]|nr:thiamine pyrophosphate-dependent enzyme [Candidatus Bathyarchaeia archaeon]
MSQTPKQTKVTKLSDIPRTERMLPGNRTCAGCGLGIALRYIFKALDGEAILVVPASCLTVLGGMYPVSSVEVPWLNVTFPSTAASAAGVAAGLRALGKRATVVGMAGDGGTLDIGIQALSGVAERNDDILYICYDNEAYMNTGTQRSGATPLGARTATTPVLGKQQRSKDMVAIMEAHGIPYIATACPSYPADLYDKVRKAKSITGTRYIHITTPCPPGWTFPTRETVKIGRLAVDTGATVLLEIERPAVSAPATFRLTGRSRTLARRERLKPVAEFIGAQRRFKGISAEDAQRFQDAITARWNQYVERDGSLKG